MDLLPVKPERMAQLEAYAASHGQSVADALDDVLAAILDTAADDDPLRVTPETDPEVWIKALKALGNRHLDDKLPILSDEALSRDSIYEDRGL